MIGRVATTADEFRGPGERAGAGTRPAGSHALANPDRAGFFRPGSLRHVPLHLTWEQKFALDIEYVDACSLRLDVTILARTVRDVLARKHVNEPGHATAREFMGTPSA